MLSSFNSIVSPGHILTSVEGKRILQMSYDEKMTIMNTLQCTKPMRLNFYTTRFLEKTVKLRFVGPDTSDEEALDENKWKTGNMRIEDQELIYISNRSFQNEEKVGQSQWEIEEFISTYKVAISPDYTTIFEGRVRAVKRKITKKHHHCVKKYNKG